MSAVALKTFRDSKPLPSLRAADGLVADSQYVVRLAANATEVTAALRLRYEVFNRELGIAASHGETLEFDQFDLRCKHLIAIEKATGRIIGTYRVNSIGAAEAVDKFYSFDEFTIETIPESTLRNSIEIGRACVAQEYRGSKALFLLWKALARYLENEGKRYIFGCCSIFTPDPGVGERAYRHLLESGHVSSELAVTPRIPIDASYDREGEAELPPLFEMYLRLGAKVCGPPMYDAAFGSIDFLVVLDLDSMDHRYRRMFFR